MKQNKEELIRRLGVQAFTLIELLVVVAIIGVLVSLILPSLLQIKDRALSAKCLNNLRSVNTAAMQFFSDNNNQLFPNKYWYRDPVFRSYIGYGTNQVLSDTCLTCSVVKRKYQAMFPRDLNQCFAENVMLTTTDPSSLYNNTTRPAIGPGRIVNVIKASAMWTFTDSAQAGTPTAGEIFPYWQRGDAESGALPFPHNKHQNTVFFDGHAEALTIDQWTNPPSLRNFWDDPRLTR